MFKTSRTWRRTGTFSDGKDSERFSKAGAAVTAVEGDGVLQLTARKNGIWRV